MHRQLLNYLLSKHERKLIINRNVDHVFNAWNLDGFLIDNIEQIDTQEDDLLVNINLKTDPKIALHLKENFQKIDSDLLIQELQRRLNAADEHNNEQ